MLKPYYEWLGCGQSRVQETSSSCRRRIKGFLRGRATFFRGGFVLVFLSLSSPLCKRAREADFTERSEVDVVSHSNVDSGLQDDEDACNGCILKEEAGREFRQCVCDWKEQTKQREANKSGSKRRWGIFLSSRKNPFFLFFFSLRFFHLPLFFNFLVGLLIKRKRSFGSFPKKHLTKRKVHVQNTSIVPRRSRASKRFGFIESSGVCPCVERAAASHGPNMWANQSVANISKSPFFFFPPQRNGRKEKKGYIQALDLFHSLSCLSFALLLIRSLQSRFPSPLLQKGMKQLTRFPHFHSQKQGNSSIF